jgi:hypothetical protein
MSAWAQQLRPAFLARTRREKVFAVILLAAVAIVWLSGMAGRVQAAATRLGTVATSANRQADWLDRRADIEARYAAALDTLSREKRPSRTEIMAQIEALVRKHGFAVFTLNPPTSQQRDQLVFHTYNLSIRSAEFRQLRAFYSELSATLSTVNLEEIKIIADRRTAGQLDARLRLVAVEINR